MFKASLENNNSPELGTVTVEFPIPEDQYEETIRALKKIKIGTTLDKDCCVADLRSTDCPALRRMINRMANVDELDWLGKQLESFDRYELLQFNAAAERFDLSSVGEMIDLSRRSREITVISDFNDLENAGKRHHLTLLTTGVPEEQGALIGTETAQRLIAYQLSAPHLQTHLPLPHTFRYMPGPPGHLQQPVIISPYHLTEKQSHNLLSF